MDKELAWLIGRAYIEWAVTNVPPGVNLPFDRTASALIWYAGGLALCSDTAYLRGTNAQAR